MYNRALVTLDGSELAEEVIPYAEDIARNMDCELILMRVAPPAHAVLEDGRMVSTVDAEVDRVRTELREYLEKVADVMRAKGFKVRTVVQFGEPAEEIVDYARDNGVDLVAMSTHGRSGVSRWVYGSVADRVLRGASTPILLIRSTGATHE
ncbi:MAG: universal stress protein [Chloroflexi bacterium]|nr:universal stress protein [Chloroflexota bacterium]